jgi:hypothetical protein
MTNNLFTYDDLNFSKIITSQRSSLHQGGKSGSAGQSGFVANGGKACIVVGLNIMFVLSKGGKVGIDGHCP